MSTNTTSIAMTQAVSPNAIAQNGSVSPASSLAVAGSPSPAGAAHIAMSSVSSSSKLATTLKDLEGMVAVVKGNIRPGGKSDQSVIFAQILPGIAGDVPRITHYTRVNFKYMAVDCDAPILPHEKKVNGMELGVKRPQLKLILAPTQMEYHFQITLDQMVRAAYEMNKTKLREAFPDLLTFTFREVTIAPTRTAPQGKIGYEVIVVNHSGAMKPLSEIFPATPNDKQLEAIADIEKDKRLIEVECVKSDGFSTKYKTFVFANLDPKIDKKSKRVFQDMNMTHSSYPDGIRKYRSLENPYRPSMSDISQWGIVIPRMIANEHGGYNFDPTSDWTKEPGFRAVTKPGERNPFMGRVGFSVDSVMEGSGHVKVWYRCQVWLMPQKSSITEDDFGEEAIVAPVGVPISFGSQQPGQSKAAMSAAAASAGAALTGKLQVGDEDEDV